MPHQQVSEYLSLVGRHFWPDLAPACEAWAREAGDRVYHLGWRALARVLEAGLHDFAGVATQPASHDAREALSGALLLAKEACRVLLDMRGLRGFRGFDEIADYGLESTRGSLFLDVGSLRFTGGHDAR